jgi:hypothetical protein
MRLRVGDDWLAWNYAKTGVYSVRSAYRALLMTKESREASINSRVEHSNTTMFKNGEGFGNWMFIQSTNILVTGPERHFARLYNPHQEACQS